MAATIAYVSKLPDCDLCIAGGSPTVLLAHYDGMTLDGRWANMCTAHFNVYGVGLGLGKGQELRIRHDVDCSCKLCRAASAEK